MSPEFNTVINELRQLGEFCDAKIVVQDGEEFLVHRNIISACSDYFRALFTSKLNPSTGHDQYVTATLEWVPQNIMRLVVDYAYTRNLVMEPDTIYDLYVTVDYIRAEKAIKLCEKFLIDNLNNENCMEVEDFGIKYLNNCVKNQAERYALHHFSSVSKTNEDILEKPVEYVLNLLSSEHLYVGDEQEVWEFALRWIEAHKVTRKYQLGMLMREIRLGLLKPDYFDSAIKKNEFVKRLYACKQIVLEVERFHDLMKDDVSKEFFVTEVPKFFVPRISHYILFAIGGWRTGAPTNVIETYDSKADRWSTIQSKTNVPTRAYHGTVYFNNKIYLIGGFEGQEYYNSCEYYDFETDTWTHVSPMNHRRCYISVAVLGGFIYALGGYDGRTRKNTAERYDPTTNQWTIIPAMNVARSDADSTVLNDKLYIIGGFNGHECLNTAEVYDPELNMWSVLPFMLSRRSGLSCIAYHDCVYAIGGFDGVNRLNSVEKFDPELNRWLRVSRMYTTRSNFTVQAIDDSIIVMGGYDGGTTISHVEEFDIRVGKWRLATDMDFNRSALSSCVVNNLPLKHLKQYIYKNRNNLLAERYHKIINLNLKNTSRFDVLPVNENSRANDG